jgi:hypothetical protein
MTVWQLICALQKMPMDAKVYSDGAIADTDLVTDALQPSDIKLDVSGDGEGIVYLGLGATV